MPIIPHGFPPSRPGATALLGLMLIAATHAARAHDITTSGNVVDGTLAAAAVCPVDGGICGPGAWNVGGDLQVAYNSTGDLTLRNGGQLSSNNSIVGAANGVPATGTVTVTGSDGGTPSFWNITGTLHVGTRVLGATGANGSLVIQDGGRVANSGLGRIGGDINDTGAVTVTGPGSLWTNGDRINARGHSATLTIADGGKVVASYVNIAVAYGTLTINLNSNGILNTGWLDKANGTYKVNLDGGILRAAANGGNFTAGGFTAGDITLLAGGLVFDPDGHDIGLGAPLSGAGGLVLNDGNAAPGTLTLNGANTYSGGTTISAGTLKAGAAGALPGGTAYAINGGTLDLNGNALSMSAFSGTGGTLALGGATLTVNQGADTSYAGGLGGAGGLTKSGAGTLTLSGANTYAGATSVDAGKLIVTGSIASAVAVNGGTLGGTGTVGDVSGSGRVSPGLSPGTLHTGNYDMSGGLATDFELGNPAGAPGVASDLIAVTGNLTLTGGTLNIINWGGGIGVGTYTLFTYTGARNGTPTLSLPAGIAAALDYGTPGEVRLNVTAIPVVVPPVAGTPIPTLSEWGLLLLSLFLAALGYRQSAVKSRRWRDGA